MLRQKRSCSTYFTMCWIKVMEDKVMVLEGLQWQYLCVQSLSHFGWIYKQHHKYTPYYSLYLTVVWQYFRYQPHAENKDSIFKIFIWSGHSWGTWHPRVTEHLWDHCGHSGRGERGEGLNWKLRRKKEMVGEKRRKFSVVHVVWHVTIVQDERTACMCVRVRERLMCQICGSISRSQRSRELSLFMAAVSHFTMWNGQGL